MIDAKHNIEISGVKSLIKDLGSIGGIMLPKNNTELKIFENQLSQASPIEPLEFFVGSCPDYSHLNGLYNHKSLGDSVPLLANYHLESEIQLLRTLDSYGIPYVYNLALADVEATDRVFASKFTNGDEVEFLRRCDVSVKKTGEQVDSLKDEQGLKGQVRSTSFFEMFTREKFMDYQEKYKQLLNSAYLENSKLRTRINSDTVARMHMYQKMYEGVTEKMNIDEKQTFYISRTVRTMAQYLALGRLIAEKSTLPIIISHPTRNMSVFNDRNKFLFPQDGNQPQLTIPVFEMNRKVY